jgi:hypothetical protein
VTQRLTAAQLTIDTKQWVIDNTSLEKIKVSL